MKSLSLEKYFFLNSMQQGLEINEKKKKVGARHPAHQIHTEVVT
jgi:hypothetical protein